MNQKQIPVFQEGKIVLYTLPQPIDVMWSKHHKLQAASIYAKALQKGYKEQVANSIAEMMINKQVYPNMQYEESWENIFKTFIV